MVITETFSKAGYCPIVHNQNFKCAFITVSEQYAYGKVKELKRHNDSDEVFVLLKERLCYLLKTQIPISMNPFL